MGIKNIFVMLALGLISYTSAIVYNLLDLDCGQWNDPWEKKGLQEFQEFQA